MVRSPLQRAADTRSLFSRRELQPNIAPSNSSRCICS